MVFDPKMRISLCRLLITAAARNTDWKVNMEVTWCVDSEVGLHVIMCFEYHMQVWNIVDVVIYVSNVNTLIKI